MKNFLIGIILLVIFSCSSNPKITTKTGLEELLIEKPKINYKLNSLPKAINVIYFSDPKTQNIFPDEVKGFLTNYYSFSKKNKYFPDIKFIDLNKENLCSLILNRDAFYFIFLFKNSLEIKPLDLCLGKFNSRNVLLSSNFDYQSNFNNLRKFIVSRSEDKLALIQLMNSYSNSIMVIDNEVTKDKFEIGEIWLNKFNKEVAEYKTFDKKESSQDIYAKLLLLNQSLKRKRKLSRIISEDLKHTSRTRQDIDALFLSVNTQEARSLKPALDYIYFEDMKVFLVNDWGTDFNFLKADKDLEGVISIDIPFILPSPLPDDLKVLHYKTRDFAIGYDAFEIALLLEGGRDLTRATYKGLTGKITFKDQYISRKSIIFKINNGIFEYLN